MTQHYSIGERVRMETYAVLASDPTTWRAFEAVFGE